MWISTRFCAALIALAALLQAGAATAAEFEKTIMTGSPSGTYIQFGRDLSREMQKCGLTLNVRESAGSLENFLAVRKRSHTQFGIVQSDVLEYLKTYAGEDPDMARAIYNIRIAFPLYNEEVHLLARKDITDLRGLAGHRVAIGAEESGTFLTASLVLDLMGIDVERVPLNAGDALQALLADRVDALFYVAGAPTKLFEAPEIDPAKYHLLPIDDPTLKAVYKPAQIPAGTYPFQPDPVDVIAVKAVLMTFEYDPKRNAYQSESCKAVSDLSNIIITRFDDLKAFGHPKWQNVDLNDLPPGWDVSECVNMGLDESYPSPCANVSTGAGPATSAANAAYRTRICAVIGC